MRRTTRSFMAVFVLAGGLAQAASGASFIEERWRNPDRSAQRYSKILVVAVTQDSTARRNFENKFVTHLRVQGLSCVTSHSLVPDLEMVRNPREVADALLGQEVDAVITVRLFDYRREEEVGSEAWRAQVGQEMRARDYVEQALSDPETRPRRYIAEFGLWDTVSPGRVWAARTSAQTLKKLRRKSGEIVQETIRLLKLDRLL